MPHIVGISFWQCDRSNSSVDVHLPVSSGFKDFMICSKANIGVAKQYASKQYNQLAHEDTGGMSFLRAAKTLDGFTYIHPGENGMQLSYSRRYLDEDLAPTTLETLRQLISECWFDGEEVVFQEQGELANLDTVLEQSSFYRPSFAALMGMIWVAFTVVFAAAMFVSAASTATSLVGASAFTLLLSVLIARAART